jgi:hypothetical protein
VMLFRVRSRAQVPRASARRSVFGRAAAAGGGGFFTQATKGSG